MNPGITIKVISEPDDDDLYKYKISLSNGDISVSLYFWGYNNNFKKFGERLINFPKALNDIVTYELGDDTNERQPKWAYHLLLSVFCFSASGQSAIKVLVDNHENIPDYQRSEFYIKSEPASLNRLGWRLSRWNPAKVKEVVWETNEF